MHGLTRFEIYTTKLFLASRPCLMCACDRKISIFFKLIEGYTQNRKTTTAVTTAGSNFHQQVIIMMAPAMTSMDTIIVIDCYNWTPLGRDSDTIIIIITYSRYKEQVVLPRSMQEGNVTYKLKEEDDKIMAESIIIIIQQFYNNYWPWPTLIFQLQDAKEFCQACA